MATWFDLPQEVKQMILCMATHSDTIIYVPKDRRYKVDTRYQQAHHFHDLLLVSKTFVTPNELAFSLLGTSKVKFHSFNELKRLCAEVKPAFKDCVNQIHLERSWVPNNYGARGESFGGFSTIKETLSNNFPKLKRIYVSLPRWCAHVGDIKRTDKSTPIHEGQISELLDRIFSTDVKSRPVPFLLKTPPRIDCVVAGFIGNRNTSGVGYVFTRPQAWLRRLVLYAEEAGIEVICQLKLCICSNALLCITDGNSSGTCIRQSCFTNPYPLRDSVWTTHNRLHVDGEMSTKDWMLRVRYYGRELKSHQQLGYDIAYAPKGKSASWWRDLLRDIRNIGF